MWCKYTIEYYTAIGNDAILQLAATLIEQQDITLNEENKKGKYSMVSLICVTQNNSMKEGNELNGGLSRTLLAAEQNEE